MQRKRARRTQVVRNAKEPTRTETLRRAREWRIGNLSFLVDFGFAAPVTDLDDAHLRIRAFLSRSVPSGYELPAYRPDLTELHWLQTKAREYVEKTISAEGWLHELRELCEIDPAFAFEVKPRQPRHLRWKAGNLKAIWLLTIWSVLTGPESRRIMRCAAPGCVSIFVKRKKGRFCRTHGSLKERARRYRQNLKSTPLMERRDGRSRIALQKAKENRG